MKDKHAYTASISLQGGIFTFEDGTTMSVDALKSAVELALDEQEIRLHEWNDDDVETKANRCQDIFKWREVLNTLRTL